MAAIEKAHIIQVSILIPEGRGSLVTTAHISTFDIRIGLPLDVSQDHRDPLRRGSYPLPAKLTLIRHVDYGLGNVLTG